MSGHHLLIIHDVTETRWLAGDPVYSMARAREPAVFKVRAKWPVRRAHFQKWMNEQAAAGVDEKGAA